MRTLCSVCTNCCQTTLTRTIAAATNHDKMRRLPTQRQRGTGNFKIFILEYRSGSNRASRPWDVLGPRSRIRTWWPPLTLTTWNITSNSWIINSALGGGSSLELGHVATHEKIMGTKQHWKMLLLEYISPEGDWSLKLATCLCYHWHSCERWSRLKSNVMKSEVKPKVILMALTGPKEIKVIQVAR